MKRATARLAGYTAGYLACVLLERVVTRVEEDRRAWDAAVAAGQPVAVVLYPVVGQVGRPKCACTTCQPWTTIDPDLSAGVVE